MINEKVYLFYDNSEIVNFKIDEGFLIIWFNSDSDNESFNYCIVNEYSSKIIMDTEFSYSNRLTNKFKIKKFRDPLVYRYQTSELMKDISTITRIKNEQDKKRKYIKISRFEKNGILTSFYNIDDENINYCPIYSYKWVG
jgi:hypothetical protein